MSRNQKVAIIVALITGICSIISAIIGSYIGKENAVNEVINQATNTINVDIGNIDDLIITYGQMNSEILALKDENLDLVKENESLKSENSALNGNTDQFLSLVEENSILLEENNLLKNQIAELQSELQLAKNDISSNQTNEITSDSGTIINNTGKKVSIFDLETFRGDGRWFIPSYENEYTDTYGNEYPKSHVANHYSTSKDDLYRVPTYLLNYQYSLCEGQIAWAKSEKNAYGSVWIDFYSGDVLLYSTDRISATDKTITFSFPVENIETLTIVKNSDRLGTASGVTIIYPYLNLVE